MAIRVLIYVATATIVVLSTGKKLERKETPPMQADTENVVAPVQI